MTQNQINYLASLHTGQWFGFNGEQVYKNMWVKGHDKPTMEEIEQGMIDFELLQWRQSATLSRRRFKIGEAVYKVNGTPLMEQIEALLAGLPEPQKTVASISYNESNSFDRLDVFVVQFGEALGMSEGEVDEFFQFCIDEAWK